MLSQSIKTIKGIGDKKAKAFEKLGIKYLYDLIHSYPYRYEDLSRHIKISEIVDEGKYLFLARVIKHEKTRTQKGKEMLTLTLSDDSASIDAVYVNLPYISALVKKGEVYWFYGNCSRYGNRLSVFHPEFYLFSDNSKGLGIRPVYSLTQNVSQKDISKAIFACKSLIEQLDETLPNIILSQFNLLSKSSAVSELHFPTDMNKISSALYRLKFEEVFLNQLNLAREKSKKKSIPRVNLYHEINLEEIYDLFPYEMTDSQKQVTKEIYDDILSSSLMERLIFGDVGSGKTSVAISAIYIAVKNDYQACIMAPTEVLSRQIFANINEILGDKFSIGLLVSNSKDKNKIYKDCQNGKIDVLVGTHALIQEAVKFNSLSLIITDEQHRFGVNQRNALKEKAVNGADILMMSATPIPRTLSMINYGDLDISYLYDMPKGRKTIITSYIKSEKDKKKMLAFIYDRALNDEQIYFLAPRIDDGEGDKISVEVLYDFLSSIYKDLKIAFIHGKMNPNEKDEIMNKFRDGEISILISTTVIEVGVDVKNASVIVITGMENFGLSQLHQLRGRVGRSNLQSYCFLIATKENENTLNRANAMVNESSGFRIAEIDLELRGPGEIDGIKQHGFNFFKLIDFSKDVELIKLASEAAFEYNKLNP